MYWCPKTLQFFPLASPASHSMLALLNCNLCFCEDNKNLQVSPENAYQNGALLENCFFHSLNNLLTLKILYLVTRRNEIILHQYTQYSLIKQNEIGDKN